MTTHTLLQSKQNKTTWFKHVRDSGATPFSYLMLMHTKRKRKKQTLFGILIFCVLTMNSSEALLLLCAT